MSPQPAPADQFADIVIITGLAKELEWFSKTIGVQFTRTARQGTSYLRGIHRVGDREISIVAVRQLDKGLTSAAVTTTKAICLWQPSVVVMTGICAGVERSRWATWWWRLSASNIPAGSWSTAKLSRFKTGSHWSPGFWTT